MRAHAVKGIVWLLSLCVFHLAVWAAEPSTTAAVAARPAPAADSAADEAWELPRLDPATAAALQDRDYPAALKALAAAAGVPGAPQADLAYLTAWTLCLDRQYDAAARACDEFLARFPQSPLASRVRFVKGQALARKGDFRGAAVVYGAEAQRLLSPARQASLADIYLEFARAYHHPPREQIGPPDYTRAKAFYLRALEALSDPRRKAEVNLALARCEFQQRRFREAIDPLETALATPAAQPVELEVRYLLGRCRLALKEYAVARRVLQDLLARDPQSTSPWTADASLDLAETWRLPQPPDDPQMNLGIAAVTSFLQRYPAHRRSAEARLLMARTYFNRQRAAEAVATLEQFLADPALKEAPLAVDAWQLLGDALQAQRKFAPAVAAWRELLARYPVHESVRQVQAKIAVAEYEVAHDAYRRGDHAQAEKLLREFLARYPLHEAGAKALLLLGELDYRAQRYDTALAQWRRLTAQSEPHHISERARAQYLIATTLENKLGRPKEALEEYRKITSGELTVSAQVAARRLESVEIELRAPRVFRSNETPRLRLATRNVDAVTLRAYTIDLETYFRKMHDISGLQRLDIALIDPDATQQHKVADYRPYVRTQHPIEVPLPEQAHHGAMAVTAGGGAAEATALVIQSDLDLVVKCAHDEVLVFTENLRTGAPWPNVRLLFSDGSEVFAEAQTGADGLFQQTYAQLAECPRLRVFAVAQGHVAAATVELSGEPAPAAHDVVHLDTDRRAYRPGDAVHASGYVRWAPPPGARSPADGKLSLTTFDARGRQVDAQPVVLDDFGTFHATVQLPAACVPGEYRLAAAGADARLNLATTFDVRQYTLAAVQLDVQTPRVVYVRGEPIEGTIRVTSYYGAPLVDRPVHYQLGDERTYTARTNNHGEVAFTVPTRELSESQEVTLTVDLPEQDVHHTVSFRLAPQDLSLDIQTPRKVYLAGETIDLRAQATDARGRPLATPLILRVLERIETAGSSGERLVQEQQIATAADGLARATARLEKAGQYALRLEGLDRFHTRVSATVDLEVSGPDDEIRLRILADQRTFNVGETARLRLSWRGPPAWALVTLDGDRLLRRQLVRLEAGLNKFAFPVTAALTPDFAVAAVVMSDDHPADPLGAVVPGRRFHRASETLRAEQELRIALQWRRKGDTSRAPAALRPGDDVEVQIFTTDGRGQPVAAQLSVGLLQRSLLELRGSPVPSLIDAFAQPARAPQFPVASSINLSDGIRRTAHPQQITMPPDEPLAAESVFGAGLSLAALDKQAPQGGPGAPPPTAGVAPAPPPSGRPATKLIDRAAGTSPSRALEAVTTASLREFAVLPAGYWNPAVNTGPDGRAELAFRLPDAATTWTLTAQGVTRQAVAGRATAEIVARSSLSGELKLPLAFTAGDRAEVLARIHRPAADARPVDVTLTVNIGSQVVTQRKTLPAAADSVQEVLFSVELRGPAAQPFETPIVFELALAAGDARDVIRRTVPLLPAGRPVYAAVGGTASSDTTLWLETPADVVPSTCRLQVAIGPSVERSLLEVVLAAPAPCQTLSRQWASDVETTTSDVLAACALQQLLSTTRDAGGPEAAALDSRIRAGLAALAVLQADDGGWKWTATSRSSQPIISARAAWALAQARAAGYVVSPTVLDRARGYLNGALTVASSSDLDTKAVLLHAQAVLGHGDYAMANHLYRDRPALSPLALVYLALTFVEMERKAVATELLELLAQRDLDARKPCMTPGGTATELRALYALAALRTAPQGGKARELNEWLLAQRQGHRWTPDLATGPATMALARWCAENRSSGDRYTLQVTINDAQPITLSLERSAATQTLDIPPGDLRPGKQRIALQLTGRGRYTYQCTLGGLVPIAKLVNRTDRWTVARSYEPAPREIDGRPVARGFTCVQGGSQSFRNPLVHLPVGARGLVTLNVRRPNQEDPLEYLVVSESVPAGASVLESSLRGGFERYEITPGGITFFIGDRATIEPIQYQLYGLLAGQYQVVPCVVGNPYRPEQLAVSAPQSLTVIPAGAPSGDPYRLTPDELLALGKAAHAAGRSSAVIEHLTPLLAGWKLRGEFNQKTVEMLLDAHLELGPPAKIVHYFEIIKGQWPNVEIPFTKILQIAAAYQALGEHERSYLVYRAAVEGSFLRDTGVAGFLDTQGEFLRSVALLDRYTRQYPPEPYVAAARFALSQQIYARADDASAEAAPADELRDARLERKQLIERSWRMLEGLLHEFPDDPAADQAAFSSATALIDLQRYAEAAAACRHYARRYPRSPLLDTFWYIIGYAQFAAGRSTDALEMCRKVAETQVIDPQTGVAGPTRNKWRAIYILGQIHHSLGQPVEAIRYYRQVEDRFPDARQAIASFLRQSIELPELTTLRPDAPPIVPLKYANVAACDLKVYRIDLLRFSEIQRDMRGIAEINLAGIRPLHEALVALGDGRDYRTRQKPLELPLKKEGAYLVVCRGENQYTSGLAIVSPLVIDVDEEPREGLVRATLRDARTEVPVPGVRVKVIGSLNAQPVVGTTDLRGVFVAEGVRGAATVIAATETARYAFHRGAGEVPGGMVQRAAPAGQPIPARNAARPTVAQTKRSPARNATAQPEAAQPTSGLFTASASEERIRAALDAPTEISFLNTPLQDVVEHLADLHHINIQIDRRRLEEVGLQLDTPVSRILRGGTLRSALNLMLKEIDLTYIVRNDALIITTQEAAEQQLRTVVYPVEDLVTTKNEHGKPLEPDFDSLIDLITSTVKPTSWDCVGGPGSIAPFEAGMALVFSQTDEVHQEVAELLRHLRESQSLVRTPVVRRRDAASFAGQSRQMGMGGMGGGFGGMVDASGDRSSGHQDPAGMGGGFVGDPPPARDRAGSSGRPAAGGGNAHAAGAGTDRRPRTDADFDSPPADDLLQGLKSANADLQRKQGAELRRTYQRGMGMGGSAGGIGAGSVMGK